MVDLDHASPESNREGDRQRNPDVDRPAKRRKIALACDECRSRKVRCDGVQPVCGACARRSHHGVLSVQCVYTVESEKKRVTRSYVTTLEKRIKVLERERRLVDPSPERASRTQEQLSTVRTHSSRTASSSTLFPITFLATPLSYQDGPKDFPSDLLEGFHSGNTSQTPTMHRDESSQPSTSKQPCDDGCDGVNAMMGAVEEERPSQGFFGSSSAASFVRQIKTAVDRKVASPESRPSESVASERQSLIPPPRRSSHSNLANYVLPPRKMADRLMEVYWTLVFPLYPFLDRARMTSEYSKIWTGESSEYDENMLMCTFNVIFALSCQLSDFIKPAERKATADVFFSRAKELLHFNLWHSGSVELIQCLLLMGQYLQSTDSAHQCWIVTSLAIRNAQSLGLHLSQTISRFRSFHEQHLARRIWHGCVLMDRVVAMTFGRPAMISKGSAQAVPLPATIDEEFMDSNSSEVRQPADRPSMMAFFSKSVELYEIMNDILLSLYMPVSDDCAEDMYGFYFSQESKEGERTIFELDRALTKWSRSLPPHLRGSSADAAKNPIFYRQSIVIRARFLYVRILLFRSILSRYCTARDLQAEDPLTSLDDSFPQRVALQCAVICVKVAQELIELIFSNTPADGSVGPLPAWWYNTLYVYAAATVLIAGRLRSTIVAEVTEAAISRSWNCALEILRRYQDCSSSARRCVAALEILYERVISVPTTTATTTNDRPPSAGASMPSDAANELSLGEGLNVILDGFHLPDLQDMSWLNSVPSNLF
ncbi:hypothetical protein VTN77DRAFT_4046 [Rasamsonia byssochlamydoides]|uniref:uncharacterized protein n=1 Tax=Rasamsonia byssochlamydoides TaxID=89139 RepID=UPI0037445FB5